MSTRKEKMRIFRSLVSLVKGLEYKYTLIDLRNDASVIGYIQQVDG